MKRLYLEFSSWRTGVPRASLWQIRLLLLLLSAALWSVPVAAEHTRAGTAPIIRFSTAEVRPWGYFDAQNQPRGTLISLTKRLQELTGLPIDNHVRPFARTINELERGVVDFAVMFAGPKSDKIGVEVGTVVEMDVLVTGLPGQPQIQSLDELSGKLVGYIRGSLYGPDFDNNQKLNKLPVKDMEQGLQMLLAGRVDVMVGTDQALYDALYNMGVGTDQVQPLMVMDRAKGKLYLSRESAQMPYLPAFRDALTQLRESGELARIFALPGQSQPNLVKERLARETADTTQKSGHL